MAGLATVYHALRDIADPSVDEAMAAALPTATGRSLHLMARTLLQRHQPAGLLGLILSYHRLPPQVQRDMIVHAGDLFRPLREAAGLPATQGPANALHIIRAAASTRLAYLVTEQLHQGTDALRHQAGDCLLDMARHGATTPRAGPAVEIACLPSLDASAVTYLQTAVHDAVAAHRRHGLDSVLCAALWLLPRPMPQTLAIFNDRQHPAAAAMQTLVRKADDPAVRRSLFVMLGIEEQSAAAIDGLRQCTASSRLGDALPGFHMLERAQARRALTRIKAPDTMWPAVEAVTAMQPHQRRGLPAYLMALPLDGTGKVARLLSLRDVEDTAVRLFALRRLIDISHGAADPSADAEARSAAMAADDAIAAMCGDDDQAIVRIAMWHLIRRGYAGLPKVLGRLVSSPHEQIRRIAGRRLAPIGFARLWETWTRLDTPRRLAAGRALMKIDPSFPRLLGERLAASDRKGRVRALNMIAELNQGALFHEVLVQLAESEDTHVASAAVKALGSAPEGVESVVRTLEAALEHDDGRVRANAIESLAQLQSTRHVQKLVQLSEDAESRPRTNAIAALMDLRTGDAVHALRRMLDDRRAEHRHSALWLIQTVGLLELARHVAEVSITDVDADVRQRATNVVRDLIELMETPVPVAVSPQREMTS